MSFDNPWKLHRRIRELERAHDAERDDARACVNLLLELIEEAGIASDARQRLRETRPWIERGKS
jgi:hypothetical protein